MLATLLYYLEDRAMSTTDIPAAIQAFIDSTNRGDSEAFTAAFTHDAHLDDWGRKFTGHEGIRDWNRTDNIGVREHFEFLGIEPGSSPDSYVVRLTVTGDGFNGTGRMTFQLRDGLIASLRIS
jgi:hypothetical protein